MLVTINRVVQQGVQMSAPAATRRSRAKSDRRSQLIAAAERLVAERGYLAVRLEDIGAAAGVSGPAINRHFPNKEALLVELLVGISTRLLAGATAVVEVQPHGQRGVSRSDLRRVLGSRPPDHQAGAGQDAACVRLDDAFIDTAGQAEVVGVDDQEAHAGRASIPPSNSPSRISPRR